MTPPMKNNINNNKDALPGRCAIYAILATVMRELPGLIDMVY
jgi:hypothetical protein